VTALTLVRRAELVRAFSRDMGDEGNIGSGFVEDLRRYHVDVLASGMGFNGGRALRLVAGSDLERFLGVLRRHVAPHIVVVGQREIAVLGIIGDRVATAPPGILARVAQRLEQAETPAVALLQRASLKHIVVVLAADDRRLPGALQALHTDLGLDRKGRS
jgi:hypothetical protein